MKKIGLTGGIGSGKSTATKILEKYGFYIISADEVSRKLVKKDSLLLANLVESFGSDILQEDGSLDRKFLGEMVFKNQKLKYELEQIMLKEIFLEMDRLSEEALKSEYKGVVIEAPTLFESGYYKRVDEVWTVTADAKTRVDRTVKRDDTQESLVMDRIRHQMREEDKISMSDCVIYNNAGLDELENKIENLIREKGYLI